MKRKFTARYALDVVDRTLAQGGDEAQGLWAVLTALRGPDAAVAQAGDKVSRTIPIRIKALPRTARAVQQEKMWIAASFGRSLKMPFVYPRAERYGDHFLLHAYQAWKALKEIRKCRKSSRAAKPGLTRKPLKSPKRTGSKPVAGRRKAGARTKGRKKRS